MSEFEKFNFQCEMENDDEPFLYPNEEIYNRTNGIAFLEEGSGIKIYDGTAIITTHRVIFAKGKHGVEIPLHYIKKFSMEGGLFSNPRVEIFLDKQ
jgi:hypothetical protein